jgi:mutator protein MutT
MVPIAIAVVEQNGQVLIGRRASDAELGGLWEFPGGKIQPNETPAQAAVRECREETGLDVEVVSLDSTVEHQYERPGRELLDVQLCFFRCQPQPGSTTPKPPFRWVSTSQLADYEFPAANRQIVAALSGPA